MNKINNQVKDTFYAFLVKEAYFTKKEEYPLIAKEMVYQDIPLDIIPFSKAINSNQDLSKTFICFYESDDNFERIR